MRRRAFLVAATAGVAGLAGCGGATGTDGEDNGDAGAETDTPRPGDGSEGFPGRLPSAVGLEPLATGLSGPLDVAFAPDADRRYVAEQSGRLLVHEGAGDGEGGLRGEPALDLREAVTAGGERGLLGVALHPEFAENRKLYVRYSAPRREGTPANYSHTFVLAEFRASADGRSVRRDTERTVLEVPQPQANHNAGSLVFGADGLLYVGVGDGGAGGDRGQGHAADWYDAVPGGNGQDVTENLLGSILRVDVDGREQGGYSIPAENPLVGRVGLDEQYAWGFRNPWRLAVDGETLYAGDVGQSRFEELDRVERGGNYGWNVREGRACFGAEDCPDRTPETVRGGEPLRDPVLTYPHGGAPVSGISIIAGNVYRGSDIPALEGTYVFGDFAAGGRLFVADPAGGEGEEWPTAVLPVAERDAERLGRLRSIGRHEGELYVLATGGDGGGLYRLRAA